MARNDSKVVKGGEKRRPPNAGIGRVKGVPNKATQNARAAIAQFVEGNVDRLTGWLDRIAEDDAKAAFQCYMDVVEYHIPKLARTEHVGEGGGPVRIIASNHDETL